LGFRFFLSFPLRFSVDFFWIFFGGNGNGSTYAAISVQRSAIGDRQSMHN